jgi:nucleotide-binding universal stress UspA family protein
MGALSTELYTMIVAMAVVTTMIMPPTLRWMMARVPLGDDEARRLEKEEAERTQSLPRMERALVYVDDSANGRLAARLAGLFAGRQQMLTTVLEHASPGRTDEESGGREQAAEGARTMTGLPGSGDALVVARTPGNGETLEREIARGYDLAFVGIERPIPVNARHFDEKLQELLTKFAGPVAIAINGVGAAGPADIPLDILLPASGAQDARLATEIALSLAHASKGRITALHVFHPQDDTALLRGRARRQGMSVLVDVHRLGKRSGVPVKGLTATNLHPEAEIRRALRGGRFDLMVLGTSLRQGEAKYLGPRVANLLRVIRTPVLLIAR